MSVLPKMHDKSIKQMNSIFENYLWNGKKPKIQLSNMQLSKKSGGLGLTNLCWKDMSLKILWISILNQDEKLANLVYLFMPEGLNQDLWKCNIRRDDTHYLFERMKNVFWYEVIEAWASVQFNNVNNFIWFNSLIKIQNKPIYWPVSFKKGLLWVHQLVPNGKAIGVKLVQESYGLSIMQYNALLSAIPKHMIARLRTQP